MEGRGGGDHWSCMYFLRGLFWEVEMWKNGLIISKGEILSK